MLGYEGAEELMAIDARNDVFKDPQEQDRLLKESAQRAGWTEWK